MILLGPPLLADYVQPVVLVGRPRRRRGAAAVLGETAPTRAITPSFTRFYMRVWALFFLEYLLVPLACLIA